MTSFRVIAVLYVLVIATHVLGLSTSRRGLSLRLKDFEIGEKGQECATPYSPLGDQIMREEFERDRARRGLTPSRRQNAPTSYPDVVFDVFINAISANMSYEGGWVTDTQIYDQIQVLNKGYEGTGISFRHNMTTRIISQEWFDGITFPDTDELQEMLIMYGSLFRKGGIKTLNINISGFTHSGGSNGFSLPPIYYQNYPQIDGVYIRWDGLPGGTSLDRQGSTVIHETGHWFSLWHTFQGGCDGIGDEISDTPAEAEAAFGCPVGRDTCPGAEGLDPIHNYMDYTNEQCRESFSPAQIERMHQAIRMYRR
ncbi:hypothetical protein BJ165DRAFT_1136524 [Panaeolus papilionaceus]|nr:hypothetical protein BJ165DRAFT_1136524 [Panaeolus papilionaceus]